MLVLKVEINHSISGPACKKLFDALRVNYNSLLTSKP